MSPSNNNNNNNDDDKKDGDENEQEDTGPDATDLVVRDGFPALRIPGTQWRKPLVTGTEPIPRHLFWAAENVLVIPHGPLLQVLREDCEAVFTTRELPAGQAYSAGQTFYLPATCRPRCALEAMVQTIFLKHVAHLEEGTYNPEQSGAEWWTLVLDADAGDDEKGASVTDKHEDNEDGEGDEDEVGLHFDADYELEEQAKNILLHPRLATVTYLSDCGAPTFVMNQRSPPMDDLKKKTLEKGFNKAWLSHPKVGKHIAFDGRLLHGAPALYFPGRKEKVDQEQPPAAKRQKIGRKRYTLLVNIWLNHWVLDAALLDEEVCAKLKTPWEQQGTNRKGDDSYVPPISWNDKVDLSKPAEVTHVTLKPSKIDPAGEDEIALCNHNVTVKYNPLMQECHDASAAGPTVELDLEDGAVTLEVGDELPDASDEEAEEDDDKE